MNRAGTGRRVRFEWFNSIKKGHCDESKDSGSLGYLIYVKFVYNIEIIKLHEVLFSFLFSFFSGWGGWLRGIFGIYTKTTLSFVISVIL